MEQSSPAASGATNIAEGSAFQVIAANASSSLKIDGDIDIVAAQKVQRLFDERRKQAAKIAGERFEINSRGGDIVAAMAIGRMFRREQAHLMIDDGSVCMSACVLIPAGAVERLVAQPSKIGSTGRS